MKQDRTGHLLTEAAIVGAALVPVYIATHAVTATLGLSRMTHEYLAIFLAGGAFHLICEATGVNDWYLDNGVAALKREK
jgi:hypothetical protein